MSKTGIALFIALLVIVGLLWHYGGCSLWDWLPVGDMPNRCG